MLCLESKIFFETFENLFQNFSKQEVPPKSEFRLGGLLLTNVPPSAVCLACSSLMRLQRAAKSSQTFFNFFFFNQVFACLRSSFTSLTRRRSAALVSTFGARGRRFNISKATFDPNKGDTTRHCTRRCRHINNNLALGQKPCACLKPLSLVLGPPNCLGT